MSNKEKTSLEWISTITMIPIDSVIEILTEDPNFIIKDDYVLIQKMLAKSESTMPEERRVSAQELREREEKLAQGICPICSNFFEPNREYCSKIISKTRFPFFVTCILIILLNNIHYQLIEGDYSNEYISNSYNYIFSSVISNDTNKIPWTIH